MVKLCGVIGVVVVNQVLPSVGLAQEIKGLGTTNCDQSDVQC